MEWSALIALVGVLLGAALTAVLQRSNARTSLLTEARIEAFSITATALHTYRKVNLDRHHLRLRGQPEGGARQTAYEKRAEAHAALNKIDLLSRTSRPPDLARFAKKAIDDMTTAQAKEMLDDLNREFMRRMGRFTESARIDSQVDRRWRVRPAR